MRSEEHTSELQSQSNLVCRLLLEKKKYAARLLRVCWPPSIAWYFSTASSRSSLVGNTVRISIRVAAPSGANVKTDSKAFGSPRDSPCSSAIRSGGAISVQEIHSW